MQGYGLDRRGWPPYRILADLAPDNYATSANPADGVGFWDFMSYCPSPPDSTSSNGANEAIHWISPRNWDYLLNYYAPAQNLPPAADRALALARAARSTPVLRVMAFIDSGGAVSIDSLRPTTGAPSASLTGSPWRLVARDASGRVLSDTGVAIQIVHLGTDFARIIKAKVPAAGAASLEVVEDGKVVAREARSGHAPQVTLLSPRAGARLHGRTTKVRWRASDADHDALMFTLRYSTDAGRSWRTISVGPDSGAMTIPTRLLSASRHAALQVRISDGFNVATATTRRLRSDGAPPSVSISPALTTTRLSADGTLLASGDAYDDAGNQIPARRLTWSLGDRVLGRGRTVSAVDLPAGRRTLKLEARDRLGRVGTASLRVVIRAVPPKFVELTVPASVRRSARRLTIRVSTNLSAVLTVAGQRFLVGRRPRTIAVRVKPGAQPIRLRAVLAAGGLRNTTILAVPRAG
jgi:hypothetical protein